MIDKYSTKEEVLAAVRECGRELKYVSDELRGDREVVMAAVNRSGDALEYASEELRADREVVLTAVKKSPYGYGLQYASENLRGDREVVIEAVNHSWWAMDYASEELKFEMAQGWLERMEQETKND
jgi:predicted  nucleic acid-binding Zn-ribbon protein